ncbi:M48 family metallopeptidase [Candidatus Uhrbacteria bacterium]|nr:M48 family metallopeptidase [Candidatus Uhrbacteria bacterium]
MYRQIDSNRWKSRVLIAIFIGVLATAGYVYGEYTGAGYAGLVFALALSIGMTLISWFAGDKIVLATSRAQELTTREQSPYVWNLVENLCLSAGMPRPRTYIIDDPAPNAFATGRNPQKASIALTTGIIQLLENEELEGVIAHELSHIKNYDTRFMILVAVLVGSLSLLGHFFFRGSVFSGRDRDRGGGGWLAMIGLVFLIVSPIIGELIKFAISRKREYLADASGALLTRYPEGLARALEKIHGHQKPVQNASTATAHLWIANPFSGHRFSKFFSTHPPIEDRVRELRKMASAQ